MMLGPPGPCQCSVCLTGVYRKEQWGVPLAAALLELRECALQQKQVKVGQLVPSTAAVTLAWGNNFPYCSRSSLVSRDLRSTWLGTNACLPLASSIT